MRKRTRSLACKIKKHASKSPQVRRHTGIPCAMVLTAYSALSLVNRALLPPSPRNAKHCRELNASVGASGPHGFAVRLSHRTPCEETSVYRFLPRVRGDREPPLLMGQDGADA
jgi:hypothetical protein